MEPVVIVIDHHGYSASDLPAFVGYEEFALCVAEETVCSRVEKVVSLSNEIWDPAMVTAIELEWEADEVRKIRTALNLPHA